MEVVGLLNSGVLVTLNDSARSSTLKRSLNLKFLVRERFSENRPGPVKGFRPVLPKIPAPVGWVKLDVANQGLPTLMPWRICNGPTWLAVCVSPGVLSALPLAPNTPGETQ